MSNAERRIRETVGKATPGAWFDNSYSSVYAADDAAHEQFMKDWDAAGRPGFGRNDRNEWFERDYETDPHVCSVRAHHGDTAVGTPAANMNYIAACCPANVKAVLTELDALRLPQRRGTSLGELAAEACDQIYQRYGEAVRECDTPNGHERLKARAAGAGECAAAVRKLERQAGAVP